ncbi:protein translocase subunit secF /protein translocase subunit secD [Terribacillus aidingensis]|uniref:Multifunctional fusion protein n=1 Tax=Terribacillus aidingensis TaxID=586416 RepID=A0A285NP76_9BACI|nr:protein translocase subunit SecDF [Terribacillus aidingensis]SNZ11259.1 protein translocase subunit secF /protein translocase subunit secD [Terribacillus aidingensis]
MVKRGRIVAFFLIVLLLLGAMGTTIQGIAKDLNLGLDLQGGFEVLYEVKPLEEDDEVDTATLNATAQALNERVNSLGVSETNIDIEQPNRIRVQLAGVEDQDQAREMLSTTANLSFRDTNDKEYLNGTDIEAGSAKQAFDPQTNQPLVTVDMKDASKFAEVTSEIAELPFPENRLVIWLDYEEEDSYEEEAQKPEDEQKFISAPSVSQTINSKSVQIEGNFTVESAQELADLLNAGSLPVKMEEVYSNSVGAQFGQQALDETMLAGYIAFALILLFMIVYYRLPGLIASITLAVFAYLNLVVFDMLNVVLTLPGIAALILGVGMAVDANIITYERIKDELKTGKSLKAAYKAGNKNSLATITDANITTLIAGIVLFIFGTSSVKGFATTLIISILLSFITAVVGSRALLGLMVKSRAFDKKPAWFGVSKENIRKLSDKEERSATFYGMRLNLVKHRKAYFTFSIALTIAGIICLSIFKLNLGIDFTSGSRVEFDSNKTLTTEQVEQRFEDIGYTSKETQLSADGKHAAVRLDDTLSKNEEDDVKDSITDAYGSAPSISTVSPVIGKELAKNAMYAVIFASIGIVLYATIRFEFKFAMAAIVALVHDAFFILAIFSITRLEFDITIIAAILTIIGYSINDTIVTFDRIKENIRLKRKVKTFEELAKIVNDSLLQTLVRSVNTVATVIVAAIILWIFGAAPITNFSIALVIGLAAGTYSSLFIAAQLWLVWRGKNIDKKPIIHEEKKKVEGPQV